MKKVILRRGEWSAVVSPIFGTSSSYSNPSNEGEDEGLAHHWLNGDQFWLAASVASES